MERMGGKQAGREGGRLGLRMLLPGTHLCGSVGVSRRLLFLACSQQLRGDPKGPERRRRGRGRQLLQPPLAEVRYLPLRPPARVSASLAAGSEAAPPRPPPPARPASCPGASGSGPDRR